jgi:vesicle-fusing ATPase
VALNSLQRKTGQFTLNQEVVVSAYVYSPDYDLSEINIVTDIIVKKKDTTKVTLDSTDISNSFLDQFAGQVLCQDQILAMDFKGIKLELTVDGMKYITGRGNNSFGQLTPTTKITWRRKTQAPIAFTGLAVSLERNDKLFKNDFNFEQMGIGGLGSQFQTIFRRAFESRIHPGLAKQLGINSIRGILLYGPPGCGKTLIARQIGKILNAREPKIINGPEVLDKYVGAAEEKIRNLFVDAEKEQAEMGDDSMLHIIIFDEMDAIMKARGSTNDNTGVHDSIVNQLLSKIDGVDSLNNILIIGMTNRKDMIDEAILRPGRLELHIEISLPNEEGRIQILNIHTAVMKKNNRLSTEVIDRFNELAVMTKNYTGAEIEGMVRNAASFALARCTDLTNLKNVDEKSVVVEWKDFERAIAECVPAFGNKDAEEIKILYRNGLCRYGSSFEETWTSLQRLVSQIRTSERTPLLSVLLEGPMATGSSVLLTYTIRMSNMVVLFPLGKSAMAAKLCSDCGFPFVRLISADSMIGNPESVKCNKLLRVFTDAYKSPLSMIFIDDIERILEYTPIGPRFSNTVLQTLLILLRKAPPTTTRLLVIATSSIALHLEDLQLTRAFNVSLHVGELSDPIEIGKVLQDYSTMSSQEISSITTAITKPIGIKQLLMVLEMAKSESMSQGDESISPSLFLDCLSTIGC